MAILIAFFSTPLFHLLANVRSHEIPDDPLPQTLRNLRKLPLQPLQQELWIDPGSWEERDVTASYTFDLSASLPLPNEARQKLLPSGSHSQSSSKLHRRGPIRTDDHMVSHDLVSSAVPRAFK
ncbi:hypothetical protein PI124_g17121 [Phytophthora idaei]|nr:hypothetical protein PI125_g17066 [Phytophthora idaei]KAG3125797.1 hypothetical protein PI126_g22605 [Phytophthora idaei]KAG3237901.1 hypothetical protein PI124_g17121 [Phytophthora idaei]